MTRWKMPLESGETLKISKKKKFAGGLPAIVESLRHSLRHLGTIKSIQTLLKINQPNGFDCPGCAWPEPENRSMAEFCENGAKAIAEEATARIIDRDFFKEYSVNELSKKSDYWLGQQGRIAEPLYLPAGKDYYLPIEWDKAFELISSELNACEDPNQAVFYTSGRTSNEAAFLYQTMVRAFGTNNLPDCSNMCHESSGVALTETIGVGKGSVTVKDLENAECIIVMGQNPGTNHPRMLTTLEVAKKNGAEIVSINPLREVGTERFLHPKHLHRLAGSGTSLSTLHLPVKINGDSALLKAIMKLLFEREIQNPGKVLDGPFIDEYTENFDQFKLDLDTYDLKYLISESGVSRGEIEKLVDLLQFKKKIIICWAMGLTQHKNSVSCIQEVVNLLLIKGAIGKEGAGVCPVRGHSNVQGDRTMGIYERPSPEFSERLGAAFNFIPPLENGFNVVEAIKEMHKGNVKVFFGMGGNLLSAAPDTAYTAEAFSKTSLSVYVSTKLNRNHLVTGKSSLILPCLARTEIDRQSSGEQFVTVENSMSIVHSSKGHLKPKSKQLKSEVAIVCELANKLLRDRNVSIPWISLKSNYDFIRDKIEEVVPGFSNFNQRIKKPEGFYLPHPARGKREFSTKNKLAPFTIHGLPNFNLGPMQLLMMTIRTHDQFNTTVYGLQDRYRGIHYGRRVILMNRDDMKKRNLVQGQQVNITSYFKEEKRSVQNFFVVEYEIPVSCTATYFPEANPLIAINSYAEKSYTPTSKSIVISVEAN
ncbi:MAG: FdhF/YdeP family oxidoreductase [Halobacteriovoraceae bacterium]|jgi:molybdopterin-dependent oxidoreductase alpha subunit|nr:FdhF/YdeP family oxidoreductase [Halobacteriovoraceae bacterium]MBT5094393.1 FdhF/YdeP family oxidoreductase [Halobacteriovoraceae bacterium]